MYSSCSNASCYPLIFRRQTLTSHRTARLKSRALERGFPLRFFAFPLLIMIPPLLRTHLSHGLFLDPENKGDMRLRWLIFNVLQGVIHQEIELSITTAVRISNHIESSNFRMMA
jgi:hypothetical protein